jgi:UDP-glucose 4-epimerase
MGIDEVTAVGPAALRTVAGQRFIIVGGAGFIGSHFTDRLLADAAVEGVTLYDNFSSGREWHYAHHAGDARLRVVRGNVEDTDALRRAMDGHDVVIHLASNPDIARAAVEPDVDFWQGTALTESVVEAMRTTSAKRLLYASGSGVYGDLGTVEAHEDHGPLLPVSTYGASKLAGEALIGSYAYMFGLTGCAFRFGNVVGPRQTHGVGFDFARRLLAASPGGAGARRPLRILGDGSQSKSYIHVSDVVAAVLTAHEKTAEAFRAYNVATGDYITVSEIAELAVECVGLPRAEVEFQYTGGDRGWKGDVPVVRLNTDRIRGLGWRCGATSREALRRSMLAMIPDMKEGRM